MLRDPAAPGRLLIGAMRCDQATFTAPVDIGDAKLTRDAVFTGCIFSGPATFAAVSFDGKADFSGASFNGDAKFNNVAFTRAASFPDCKFSTATFSSVRAASDISFKNAALTSLSLTTDRSSGMGGTLTLTGLRATGEVDVCAEAPTACCDYAEFAGLVRLRLGWASAIPAQPGDLQEPPPPPTRLAVLYRQLRQAIEEARNAPGAADLYYGEMEMRRLSTKGRDERWLLAAYWLVSGYGLRASRSMLILGGLILAAAEALQRTGFGHHPPHPGYVDCLLYAMGSVLSLDLSGHLPATLSDWGQLIRMALRIGGPVLLGLAALALRGRITR